MAALWLKTYAPIGSVSPHRARGGAVPVAFGYGVKLIGLRPIWFLFVVVVLFQARSRGRGRWEGCVCVCVCVGGCGALTPPTKRALGQRGLGSLRVCVLSWNLSCIPAG